MNFKKESAIIIMIVFAFVSIVVAWNKHRELMQADYYKKGTNLVSVGKFDPAIQDLQQATRLNQEDDKSQRILGKAYEAKGELDKALDAYEASLKINPEQPEVLYNIAIIYKSQGKTEAAIENLVKALAINRQFVAARLMLADLYKQIGSKEKAREEYQAIIDMNPFGVDITLVKKKMAGLR